MLRTSIAPLLSYLLKLTRYQKRFALIVVDLVLLNVAVWLAMSASWGYFYMASTWDVFLLLAAVPPLAVGALFRVGLYRHVTRHFGAEGTQLIAVCVSLSAIVLGVGAFLTAAEGIPRTALLLYPLFGILALWGCRRVLRQLIIMSGITLPPTAAPRSLRNVAIYGAGTQGHALYHAIRRSRDLAVVGFVDPDPTLWRQYVDGIRVHAPQHLPNLVRSQNVTQVLLALQNASRDERLRALRWLENCPAEVRSVPPIEDIASGRVSVSDLRRVEASDLLGREPIPADPALMSRNIRDKCVLVTGAGGSIGSELVRQVLRCAPRRLVMLDASETNIYTIEQEVHGLLRQAERQLADYAPVDVVAVLGSVSDDALVRKTLQGCEVQTIYHAAAFKHVPIVEHNPIVGLRNNTLGTEGLVQAAESEGVETFVLISTDKAVRPSSVLGASKRVAEMLLQARAASGGSKTVFSIVRFGNVLDSSGSVVQLFRRQIEAGGPITVTHPEAVRYFISIPEAAQLVIQAGAMARGGEVFALDMGQPVRIVDLARMMIQVSGRQFRDAEHPDGDIEIVYSGLRPGEKLVEELHLSSCTIGTDHPRIVRINEPYLPADELAPKMQRLRVAIEKGDPAAVRGVLSILVEDYGTGPGVAAREVPAPVQG